MAEPAVAVNSDLDLEVDGQVVTHLQPAAALSLSADLARAAFRRIASEERADFLFDDADTGSSAPPEAA